MKFTEGILYPGHCQLRNNKWSISYIGHYYEFSIIFRQIRKRFTIIHNCQVKEILSLLSAFVLL